MSLENPLWGATKMHGEPLKLGIAVAQSTVSIYLVPRRDRALQTWKTFLRTPRVLRGRKTGAMQVVDQLRAECLLRSWR
jgi:hypothetical protein